MPAIYHMTYLQAVVIGLIQGLTELFPISSLGHTVLIPSWLGGTWATLVSQESRAESPYLAFIVGLHLATAVVLLGYYAKTWVRVIRGFFTSIVTRRVESADQKLAWLLIVATVPVGIAGLVLEHPFRVLFAKPLAAAIFLTINGLILAGAEVLRRREKAALAVGAPQREPVIQPAGVTRPASQPARPAGGGAHAARRPEPSAFRGERDERDAMLDEAAEQRLAGVGIEVRAVDRRLADPGPVRGDQPRRRDHGRRPGPRAQPRGRAALLVPAVHAGHPGRRATEDPRPDRAARP